MIEIDASAAQNEMPAAIKKSIPRLTSSEKNISRPFKTLAPKIAGIANNNEKRAAEALSYPKKRAAVIVTPARLATGINASI